METNYQMLKALNDAYAPVEHGVVSGEEVCLIREKLHLDEMDILQLRNLRDETVMFYTIRQIESYTKTRDEINETDKMSAITAVIDQKIFNLGGEV